MSSSRERNAPPVNSSMWRIFSISSAVRIGCGASRRIGRSVARCTSIAEQVRPRTDERHERHHELFADRVDRRVGHLREQLLEVVVEDLRPVRQHRQRGVVAHRADRLLAVHRHRRQDHLQVFLRVAERLLAVEQRHLRAAAAAPARADRRARCAMRSIHCAIRLRGRQRALQLVVVDDAALLGVDQQHLARLQPPLLDDLALGNVEHADFGGHHRRSRRR